jgi:hypothetical protein
MSRTVVAFVLVAAASAVAHADCASTASSAVDRMMALEMADEMKTANLTPDERKMAETMADQMKPKMKAAMTESCIKDKWTKEALDCMDAAADMASMEKCEGKLSAPQKASLNRAMSAALADHSDDATKQLCLDASSADADVLFGVRAVPATGVRKTELARRRAGAASLKADLFALCLKDHWSREAASCMTSVSTLHDLVVCRAKLQRDAIDNFRQEAMKSLAANVDCAGAMRKAVEQETVTWVLAESCSAGWWPSSVLTCFERAKASKAVEGCEGKLTASQRTDLETAMSYATGMVPGLPPECQEYGAAINRLAACDKMPAQARSALLEAWKQASAGWVNLPPDSLANLATACKTGRDAVIESGKSVCGW